MKKMNFLSLLVWLLLLPVVVLGHIPEEGFPTTDLGFWNYCCDKRDCKPGIVRVSFKHPDAKKVWVSINGGDYFEFPRSKTRESENGVSYYCHTNDKPPGPDNVRCVFYLKRGEGIS